VAVTTNYAINGLGDSYKRRMEEFELTKFYSATFTPADEFGHTFFYDWDSKQWNSFFNLLIHATQNYLRDGIVNAPSATGNQKKLQNMLNWEMLEFISDQIKVNDEYEVGQLFNQFISTYPDYKNLRQRTFTSWLKMFAQVNDYRWTDRHSGSLRYFAMAASNLDSIYENGCMVEFAKTI
jgi:hypothetical protein